MHWINQIEESLMKCLTFLDFRSPLALSCCTACKTLSYTYVNLVVLLRRAEQMHFTSRTDDDGQSRRLRKGKAATTIKAI